MKGAARKAEEGRWVGVGVKESSSTTQLINPGSGGGGMTQRTLNCVPSEI